jgi:hypothetical protein
MIMPKRGKTTIKKSAENKTWIQGLPSLKSPMASSAKLVSLAFPAHPATRGSANAAPANFFLPPFNAKPASAFLGKSPVNSGREWRAGDRPIFWAITKFAWNWKYPLCYDTNMEMLGMLTGQDMENTEVAHGIVWAA